MTTYLDALITKLAEDGLRLENVTNVVIDDGLCIVTLDLGRRAAQNLLGATDFGNDEPKAFFAYTADRVYFVHVADTHLSIESIPRNPTKYEAPKVI